MNLFPRMPASLWGMVALLSVIHGQALGQNPKRQSPAKKSSGQQKQVLEQSGGYIFITAEDARHFANAQESFEHFCEDYAKKNNDGELLEKLRNTRIELWRSASRTYEKSQFGNLPCAKIAGISGIPLDTLMHASSLRTAKAIISDIDREFLYFRKADRNQNSFFNPQQAVGKLEDVMEFGRLTYKDIGTTHEVFEEKIQYFYWAIGRSQLEEIVKILNQFGGKDSIGSSSEPNDLLDKAIKNLDHVGTGLKDFGLDTSDVTFIATVASTFQDIHYISDDGDHNKDFWIENLQVQVKKIIELGNPNDPSLNPLALAAQKLDNVLGKLDVHNLSYTNIIDVVKATKEFGRSIQPAVKEFSEKIAPRVSDTKPPLFPHLDGPTHNEASQSMNAGYLVQNHRSRSSSRSMFASNQRMGLQLCA